MPEFSAATFALKPKTVTQTPVKTDYGYHIIYLEAFRLVPPPKLEEVREQLVNDYMQAAANQIIEACAARSKIELFTMDGKPVEVQAAPAKIEPRLDCFTIQRYQWERLKHYLP